MEIEYGISDSKISEVITMLSAIQADEYVLCNKTHEIIKNLEGGKDHNLQRSLEGQLVSIDLIFDKISEKICSLGHDSLGTHKYFLNNSRLGLNKSAFKKHENLLSLQMDHQTILESLKKDISDLNENIELAGFLNELLLNHETMVWTLKAYLSQFNVNNII